MKNFLFIFLLLTIVSCNPYKGKFSYVSIYGVVEQHGNDLYINQDSLYFSLDKPQKLKKYLGREIKVDGWLVKRHSAVTGGAHVITYTLYKAKISSVDDCKDREG